MRLAALEVLVVDCQATAAGPTGQLLELGWGRVGAGVLTPRARLIRLPPGARVPPAVARITGITDRVLQDAVPATQAWAELMAEAALVVAPHPNPLPASQGDGAPTVAHFARFEQPFLERLAGGRSPLALVCTHEIARRLFPGLPRRSLRALAGYFGHGVTALRRSAEHVEATAAVWRAMIPLLAEQGVHTWDELKAWLTQAVDPKARAKRAWPMPRALRLALPDAPGLYRMLRTSGDVLYVGKATSLHHRVNSYFRKQHGVHERTLEMLSQARGLSFEVVQSPLEAALLEPDEIKRHRPPYNVALAADDRAVWFTDPALSRRSQHASRALEVGPFPSDELLEQVAAFSQAFGGIAAPHALGRGRWAPTEAVFSEGLARVVSAHAELRGAWALDSAPSPGLHPTARVLRLGARLWREGRRDRDDEEPEDEAPRREWTPALVAAGLERLALRAALALRRARWLTRLVESSLCWSERGGTGERLLVISAGELVTSANEPGAAPPIPPGHARSIQQRLAGFTVARLDRLRVLTTELKRLVAEQQSVTLRLGPEASFTGPRLARILEWL